MTKITVSIEKTFGTLGMYSIVAQTEGYPKSEAHDDMFPKETAKEVAKQVAEEIQQANPDKKVVTELGPSGP